jgi:hypothetical protein
LSNITITAHEIAFFMIGHAAPEWPERNGRLAQVALSGYEHSCPEPTE